MRQVPGSADEQRAGAWGWRVCTVVGWREKGNWFSQPKLYEALPNALKVILGQTTSVTYDGLLQKLVMTPAKTMGGVLGGLCTDLRSGMWH